MNRRIMATASDVVTAVVELPQCIRAKKNRRQKVDILRINAVMEIRLAKEALSTFICDLFPFIMR